MFFGLDADKLLLIGVIAIVLVGPQKLPRLAQQFARFLVKARAWASDAKSRVKEEMGDDLDDVDWRQLDPRQYDPRRIIRQALLEDAPTAAAAAVPVVAAQAAPQLAAPESADERAMYATDTTDVARVTDTTDTPDTADAPDDTDTTPPADTTPQPN